MPKFNEELESWYADTVGKCFQKSVSDGFDSYVFAKEFLNSKWGRDLLIEKRIKEYESLPYMYAYAIDNLNIKLGETYDEYLMWMYGYLVKYWVAHRNTQPEDIWKILPIDAFDNMFGFYHTQGWNYIIEDAISRNKSVGDLA